jgi:hypothetical protein
MDRIPIPLSPRELRAEADKHDRLVHRHARNRIVGSLPEDSEPWELTTDTKRLTVDDRHTLVSLFRRQAEMYQELADQIEEEARERG